MITLVDKMETSEPITNTRRDLSTVARLSISSEGNELNRKPRKEIKVR